MVNLTDLLRKSTIVKNEQGYISAINYLKALIIDNDLKDKDAMRCTKKIASFIKHESSISIDDATSFFLKTIQERISNSDCRIELYFHLSEFYFDKKEFDLSFKMINGVTASTTPNDFSYLHNLRRCYNKTAMIVKVSISDKTERSLEYLFRITNACLFEIASEINFSLLDKLRFYFDYSEDDFSENYYLNDDEGNFDSALITLGIFEKKKEIVSKIHKFATYDIPKRMGFSEKLLAGDKSTPANEEIEYFIDAPMILDFSKELYLKYNSTANHG